MSKTFQKILDLIDRNELRISYHGYDELANDDIFVLDVLSGLKDARMIEDYLDY